MKNLRSLCNLILFLFCVSCWVSHQDLVYAQEVKSAVVFSKEELRIQAKGFQYSTKAEAGETLSEISTRLFGTMKKWKKIAAWNEIGLPFRVRAGRVLFLELQPTLSSDEGQAALISMWRKRFGLIDNTGKGQFGQGSQLLSNSSPKPMPKEVQKMVEETKKENRTMAMKEEIEAIPDAAKLTAQETKEVEKKVDELPEGEFQAKGYYELGLKFFQAKQFEKAIGDFKKSRKLDPDLLAPWFYEIKSLRLLRQDDAAKDVVAELLDRRPELKDLPVLQQGMSAEDSSNQSTRVVKP